MSDRLATWAPVALLLLLAALTWWLDSKVQPASQRPDGSLRHDPDMYLEGYSATRMTPEGIKQYQLTGKRLVHYPDDNSTELQAPQLVYFDPDKATVTVKADVAHVSDGGKDVYFSGNVQLVRAPYGENPELGILTTYLHVIPERQFARTDKPVTLMEGNSTATSLGLEFDNKTRQLTLTSEVRARYENPRSLKQVRPRR
jgi:lipopolysaccharide export system protein LptC